MFRKTGKYDEPLRSFRCIVKSKHDEKVSMGLTNFRQYRVVLENDYGLTSEYIATGKFKYFQFDKLKAGTQGTAFVRGNTICRFFQDRNTIVK
jgi:hypothetical protein